MFSISIIVIASHRSRSSFIMFQHVSWFSPCLIIFHVHHVSLLITGSSLHPIILSSYSATFLDGHHVLSISVSSYVQFEVLYAWYCFVIFHHVHPFPSIHEHVSRLMVIAPQHLPYFRVLQNGGLRPTQLPCFFTHEPVSCLMLFANGGPAAQASFMSI